MEFGNPHGINERDWYFGDIGRDITNKILLKMPNGSFLVRESTQASGYAISVKEERRIVRYLIIVDSSSGTARFKIGKLVFDSLDALMSHYSTHVIGDWCLLQPAPKWTSIALYSYEGKVEGDLSVERGELLSFIMQKEKWTFCQSQKTQEKGWIPTTYIKEYDSQSDAHLRPTSALPSSICQTLKRNDLPVSARVIHNRNPNIYDQRQLKLKIGEEVEIRTIDSSGMCEVFHKALKREGIAPIIFLHIQKFEATP